MSSPVSTFSPTKAESLQQFVHIQKPDGTGGLLFLRGTTASKVDLINLRTGFRDRPITNGSKLVLDLEASDFPNSVTVLAPDSATLTDTNPWTLMPEGGLPLDDLRFLRDQDSLRVEHFNRKGMIHSEVLIGTLQGNVQTWQFCATVYDGTKLGARKMLPVSSYNGCGVITGLLCQAHVSGAKVSHSLK